MTSLAEIEDSPSGRHPRAHVSHGFTLVELLVVVAVIALLIAMLLPALGQARSVAYRIKCATNTRSWAQMALTYAVDSYDALPPRGHTYIAPATVEYRYFPNLMGTPFKDALKGYGSLKDLWMCPDGGYDKTDTDSLYTAGWSEYCYYGRLTQVRPTVDPDYHLYGPHSPVANTDDRDNFGNMSILFADVSRHNDYSAIRPFATNNHGPVTSTISYTGTWDRTASNPAGVNVAYIDAHVSWIPFQDLNQTRRYRYWDSSFYWTK